MTSKIILTFLKKKIEKLGFAFEKSWESCSFGWEMFGDEDLNTCEMVENLLISKMWEPCDGLWKGQMLYIRRQDVTIPGVTVHI